jgi:hypothetical protein
MPDETPVADVIAALAAKSPAQRHAIARLLQPDGPSLDVLHWIAGQPDCDLATASMIFWRLLCLPANESVHAVQHRARVLELVLARSRGNEYRESRVGWDGMEVWDRTVLVGGTPSLPLPAGAIPTVLFGPFTGETPGPATHAFFEVSYEEDDAFDSLWRINRELAAAADWLTGKPAEVWMAAVEELYATPPNELYLWMVTQPECPAAVAGQIFWLCEPELLARDILSGTIKPKGALAEQFAVVGPVIDRWRASGFTPSDLDFSRFARPAKYRAVLGEFPGKPDPLQIPHGLADPVQGRRPEVPRICDEFAFWCIKRGLSSFVPRPRSAAMTEWKRSLAPAPPEPSRGWRWRDLFR